MCRVQGVAPPDSFQRRSLVPPASPCQFPKANFLKQHALRKTKDKFANANYAKAKLAKARFVMATIAEAIFAEANLPKLQ